MIRKATHLDIDAIENVAASARAFIKTSGSLQWQDGYPFWEVFVRDIDRGVLYVYEEAGEILGIVSLISGRDENYAEIFEGSWLNDEPYYAIHNLAVSARGRGNGKRLMGFAEEVARENGIRNLRCDTAEENLIMQHLLASWGYERCGVIYLKRTTVHNKRIAYQKILQNGT